MRLLPICLVVCLLATQAACSVGLPRVHKVTIQQGNVITQDMIDRLEPGMTRSQVAYVMGEPVLRHAFKEDRWDYIYTLQIPGYYDEQKRVSLYFENDVLAYFTGDYAPTSAKAGEAESGQTTASAGETPEEAEDDPS